MSSHNWKKKEEGGNGGAGAQELVETLSTKLSRLSLMRLITFLSKAWKKKKTLAPQKKLPQTDKLSFLLKFYFDKMRILKSAHVSLI